MGFFTSYSAAHRSRICNMVYYFTDAGERGTTAGAVIWHCIQIRPTHCGCGTISIRHMSPYSCPLSNTPHYRQRKLGEEGRMHETLPTDLFAIQAGMIRWELVSR